MSKHTLNALIIGAGKIGAFLDDPSKVDVLTHAHGYVQHKGFDLVGFVDIKKEQAEKAAEAWGGRAYTDLGEAFNKENVDVISLCTPEDDHYKTLNELKQYSYKGGIIEKALTNSIETAKEIADNPFFTDKRFLVNYMRRYLPSFQMLREKIISGAYGSFVTGSMRYGKGILRNGSHLIDLARFLGFEFGGIHSIGSIDDFYDWDSSYDAILQTKAGGYIVMQVVPANLYRVFDMNLFFTNGSVKILDSGFVIEEYKVGDDSVFAGYRVLELESTKKTELGQYMLHVVDDLYKVVTAGEEPLCTVQDAYEAQRIVDDIENAKRI